MNMETELKNLLNRIADTAAYNSKLAGELGNLLLGPAPEIAGELKPTPTPVGLIPITIDQLQVLLSEVERTRAQLSRLNDALFSQAG